tara:strand:- start:72 stop:434 length:363 start_codon:yes stop_codon:yes gene_type:complete
VIAADQKFIPRRESSEQFLRWYRSKFAALTPIALLASEYKVPDSINVWPEALLLERMREEVVYLWKRIPPLLKVDTIKAVKALTFLITIECIPAAGDVFPAQLIVDGKQPFGTGIMIDSD